MGNVISEESDYVEGAKWTLYECGAGGLLSWRLHGIHQQVQMVHVLVVHTFMLTWMGVHGLSRYDLSEEQGHRHCDCKDLMTGHQSPIKIHTS